MKVQNKVALVTGATLGYEEDCCSIRDVPA